MSSNNATVPTIFGATVNKFVRTVEYPRLATICGRKLLTLASGTPKDKLISAHSLRKQQRNAIPVTYSANESKGTKTCLPVHGICEWTECVANVELFIDVHRGVR